MMTNPEVMTSLRVRNCSLFWATFGVTLLHAGLCLLVWNPQDITYVSDEGTYLILGKSLAQNGEYRSISWPEEPKHVKRGNALFHRTPEPRALIVAEVRHAPAS